MANHLFRQNHSITLEQIKTYIYVYELQSISSAANMVHKTQPAVTHSLNQLEKKLNTQLIKRNRGKTITFTEKGHSFYQKVMPIVGQLLVKIDEIENKQSIGIGVCDDLTMDMQMQIYAAIHQHTRSELRLLCDFLYRISDMVSEGRLSFGIVKKNVDVDRGSSKPEHNHAHGYKNNYESKNNRPVNRYHWVSNKDVDFNEPLRLAMVSAHQGCFARDVLEKALYKQEKDFYFSYIANHLASQAEAISAGFGVGMLDTTWVERYPNLMVLDEKQGFPVLPSFQYHCIGEPDNSDKEKAYRILQHIVAMLNAK